MTTAPHREQALSAAFVEMADTLVADYDVVELAHRLVAHCVHLLPVASAGLLLTDERDQLRLLAASDEHAQIAPDNSGPCLEAFRSGQPVHVDDLAEPDDRSPGFAEQAHRRGFRAVHGLPMRLREQIIGALVLFRTAPGRIASDDLQLAQALADVATIGILQQRTLARRETAIEQLQGALNSRIAIEQAKGALAHRGGVDLDAAFDRLRGYARAHRSRLTEVAAQVTRDPVLAARILAHGR
jgi:GAF domain-containing protein